MTTNFQLLRKCKNIPYFSGVYMIDEFVGKKKPFREKAIVNLANSKQRGSHWSAFKIVGNKVSYFDAFGQLPPPRELLRYFGKKSKVTYNRKRYQSYSSNKCGELCVKFLRNQL